MIRRSFRRGLAFGLAGGAVMTALKAIQARREKPDPAGPAEWPPIPEAAPMKVPEPAADVAVAPGPEPQPARTAGAAPATAATPPPPHAAPPVSRPAEPPIPAKKAPAKAAAPKSTKKAAKKATKGASQSTGPAPWIEPVQGECPASHPVKAKLSSKIFHLPGGLNYERTRPDRCYVDTSAAEGDGLRAAKR